MARPNVRRFGLNESEAMDKIETIYEQRQTSQQSASSMPSTGTGSGAGTTSSTGSQQPAGEAQQPLSMQPLKTEKSVKVTIPMDYYFRLARLKECTGKTLQELAAQGVIEFIDRYSQG
jgi:hypothetical protein|nr:MAG TPA: Ribbon-helix-helix domain [Caudoviricetes sp.]